MPDVPHLARPCTVWSRTGADGEAREAIRARYDAGSMTITKGPALAAWLAEAPDGPPGTVRDSFLAFMGRWLDADRDTDAPALNNWMGEEMP